MLLGRTAPDAGPKAATAEGSGLAVAGSALVEKSLGTGRWLLSPLAALARATPKEGDSNEKKVDDSSPSSSAETATPASSAGSATPSATPQEGITRAASNLSAVSEQGDHMDLSGSWKLTRIDGDMDAFLKEVGVNWMMRSAAKAMNFGIGKMTNDIQMTEDSIEIINWTPKGNHKSFLKLDGTEQRNTDPMNGTGTVAQAQWVDSLDAISIESRCEVTGKEMPVGRRYLKDGEMHVEQRTKSGLVATRVFTRGTPAEGKEEAV